MGTGEVKGAEYRIRRKDGAYFIRAVRIDRYVLASFVNLMTRRKVEESLRASESMKRPLFRDDGTLDVFLGVGVDISERVRAEKALRDSEEDRPRSERRLRLQNEGLLNLVMGEPLHDLRPD